MSQLVTNIPSGIYKQNLSRRLRTQQFFHYLLKICMWISFGILGFLLSYIFIAGYSRIQPHFFTNFPSRFPDQAGIFGAVLGSFWILFLTITIALPVGVGAAIFLEEFAPTSKRAKFFELSIANLAGVPAIVYGILGLALFVRWLGFDRSLLSGALTMSLLVLPTIIVTAKEALHAVPFSIREAAYALGATKTQACLGHVLPAALPQIMTGLIFAVSRAAGEAAPLILVGGTAFVSFIPESIFDAFTVLPIQIYSWASKPQEAFQELAAAGIIVLLLVLLSANALAVFIRNRSEKRYRW